MKVERLVTKCNEAFMTVLDKKSYLEAMTTKNNVILTSAQNYINSADDKASEFQETRASTRS